MGTFTVLLSKKEGDVGDVAAGKVGDSDWMEVELPVSSGGFASIQRTEATVQHLEDGVGRVSCWVFSGQHFFLRLGFLMPAQIQASGKKFLT